MLLFLLCLAPTLIFRHESVFFQGERCPISHPPPGPRPHPRPLSVGPYPFLAGAFSAQKVTVLWDKVRFGFSMNFLMTHLLKKIQSNRSKLVPRKKGSFSKNGIYSQGNLSFGKCQVWRQLLPGPSGDT